MDSLLCNEVWLSSPCTTTVSDYRTQIQSNNVENYGNYNASFCTNKEDCERTLSLYLEKELRYMAQHGYSEHKDLLFPRFKAIQWLIKSRSRLNLSFESLFNAANYLDRLMSMNQCIGWKNWMLELLSVACLSVAAKFNETSAPSLHEIQIEDMDYTFQPVTIQRMELVLLKALDWRLGSITAYSYVEVLLIMMNTDSLTTHLQNDLLAARVTELLLATMLDCKFVEHRPSTIAASALWCGLEELVPSKSDSHLAYITGFFNQDQKDDIVKCHKILKEKQANPMNNLVTFHEKSNYCPSSPVTVLLPERIDIYDGHVDLSVFKAPSSKDTNLEPNKKRIKMEMN